MCLSILSIGQVTCFDWFTDFSKLFLEVSENQESLLSKFSRREGMKAHETHYRHLNCNSPPLLRSSKIHNFADGKSKFNFNEDTMNNFPKLSFGSPKSSLKDFCQFASSPSESVVIWKEPNEKDKIFKVMSFDDDNDDGFGKVGTELSLERMIESVLKKHTAYDAMPLNSRCVILDLKLKVGSAFDALTYDGIHAAPLWDDMSRSFVGMLTITDFINILQQYLDEPEVLSAIRNDCVDKWRDHLLDSHPVSFLHTSGEALTMSVDSKLGEVLTHLLTNKIHRVIIVDPSTGNALYIGTFRQILKYLWQKLPLLSNTTTEVMNKSIFKLNIGSYENLISVGLQTTASEIFSILLSRRLSSIPVVDDNFCVIDLFRKADVMSLIFDGSFNKLFYPLQEVLNYERNGFEGLYKCQKADSAYNVISAMVVLDLHRVVVVDEYGRLEGIVSLSDVIKFIVNPDRMNLDC